LFGWLYSEDESLFILLQDTLIFLQKNNAFKENPLKALQTKQFKKIL